MRLTELTNWDALARAHFTYQADGAIDEWLSHADEALAGKPWFDDCDGLASTYLDLCTRAGLPLQDAYQMAVIAPNGQGHMVACTKASEGRLWIGGDTFAPIYAAERMRHKPQIYHRLSEFTIDPVSKQIKQTWRKGAPWILQPET
jgi:hypothetical protein